MKARKRRSDEVVAEILLGQLAIIRANVDGTVAGADPEALHDLRVAVRRSRTLLKGMPGVFVPADRARFAAEFKELQLITGPVRDLDVLLESLEPFAADRPQCASGTDELAKALTAKRRAAQNKLKRRLVSKRFSEMLDAWQSLLEQLPSSEDLERPDAHKAIGKLSRQRVTSDRKRFEELGQNAARSGEPAEVHHARKRGKSLRYNLEFFGRFGDEKSTRRTLRRVSKLQDELGAYQDTVVQEAAFREAAESLGSVDGSLAAGALIERLLVTREERLGRLRKTFRLAPGDGSRREI